MFLLWLLIGLGPAQGERWRPGFSGHSKHCEPYKRAMKETSYKNCLDLLRRCQNETRDRCSEDNCDSIGKACKKLPLPVSNRPKPRTKTDHRDNRRTKTIDKGKNSTSKQKKRTPSKGMHDGMEKTPEIQNETFQFKWWWLLPGTLIFLGTFFGRAEDTEDQ